MTRKRFVKLLMAKGYDRNEANMEAETARTFCRTYDQQYKITLERFVIISMLDSIKEATQQIQDTAVKIVCALGAGLTAFTDAYNKALRGEEE